MKQLRVALLTIASFGPCGCGSDEGGSSMANGSAGVAGDGSDGGSAGAAVEPLQLVNLPEAVAALAGSLVASQ